MRTVIALLALVLAASALVQTAGCCCPPAPPPSSDGPPEASSGDWGDPPTPTAEPTSTRRRSAKSKPRPSQVVLDIPKLVGLTKPQMDRALGAGKDCSNEGRRAKTCMYKDDQFKVTFIDKKADRFRVDRGIGAPDGPDALPALGIDGVGTPSFQNEFLWRWKDVKGFKEITVDKGYDGHAGKVLIKTKHGDEVFQ